jgi:hypothetical protein
VYAARGDNIETMRFASRCARDDAARVFSSSDFVRIVEKWDELHSVPVLIRGVVEGI